VRSDDDAAVELAKRFVFHISPLAWARDGLRRYNPYGELVDSVQRMLADFTGRFGCELEGLMASQSWQFCRWRLGLLWVSGSQKGS